MAANPEALLTRALSAKFVRYSAASAVSVLVSQICLFVFISVLDWHPAVGNIGAVAISSVPAYLINRAWVWQKRDGHSLRREVVPFWGMAFLGLVLSTALVAFVGSRTDWAPAIGAANLGGFGVLWVAKFFVLDRVLFGPDAEHEPPPVL